MKVQRLLNPENELWEVIDEGAEYYILKSDPDGHGVSRIGHAKKSHCKPIPTEQWRDVTAEFRIEHIRLPEGYRPRQVQLFKRALYDWKDGSGKPIPGYDPILAFLIERKESHD